jgi:prophage regulatory protein
MNQVVTRSTPPALRPASSSAILPETGFVRINTVLQVFPISRSGWWQGVRDRKYPAAYKLSPRCTAWKVEDIRALLEQLSQR